jgi:hypothetical protein
VEREETQRRISKMGGGVRCGKNGRKDESLHGPRLTEIFQVTGFASTRVAGTNWIRLIALIQSRID